jgi:hypothetical protein
MNPRKKYRFALLGVALLLAAAHGQAMTLGRAGGAVLLGQPLKLSVPIQLESGEAVSALCFEAEVFYGDTRQDASRVAVTSDHFPEKQSASVYVNSYANVDEPVVTVYLRVGCEYKSTRRFVLLADLASETVRPVTQFAAAAPTVLPTVPPVAAPKVESNPVDRAAKSTSDKKRRSVDPDVAPGKVAALSAAPKAPSIRRSHLKLLPMDLTVERDPALKLSTELYLGESENLQKRAEAAALWRSLNATPQDILGTDSLRQSTQTELKGLQVASDKDRQTMRDLVGRLEAAESQRYANPLVYGLIGILLLCGLGLAYVFFRMRQGGLATPPWWGAEEFTEKSELSSARTVADDLPATSGSRVSAVQVLPVGLPIHGDGESTSALTEVDIDLHLDESHFSNEREKPEGGGTGLQNPSFDPSSRSSGHVDFEHSMATITRRDVNTQEMLDVRQQADFFMALGQHDEALGLLKDCVDGSAESNPLVYLDLLKMLHTLGRKAEFDHYRSDFNALFSGHIPVYTAFNQGGEGLEAYPDICNTIDAVWPSEQAIEYIEKCLVHKPEGETKQGMDLEAFRDLLMLHGVANRLSSGSDSGLLPFLASRPSPVEAGAGFPAETNDFDLPERAQPVLVDGIRVGNTSVDIDLPDAPGNLIDFHASAFSLPGAGSVQKP